MVKKILCVSLILISLGNGIAQSIDQNQLVEITYDYNKNQLTGKMPFDDYFKIIYKGIEAKNIDKVYLFEVVYKEDHLRVRTKRKPRNGDGIPDVAERFQNLVIEKNNDDDKSSYSIVAPLDPERAYVIGIFKKNSESNVLMLTKFFELIVNEPYNTSVQKQFFQDSILPLEDNLDKLTIPIGVYPRDFDKFIGRIRPVQNFYSNTANKPNLNQIILKRTITGTLISTIATALKSKGVGAKIFNEIIPMFLNNELSKIETLSYGYDISPNTDSKINKYDYHKRIKKLEQNLKSLKSLKKEIEALQLLQNDNSVKLFYKDFIVSSIEILKANIKELKFFNRQLKKLINQNLPEIILIDATTLGNDLKTSNASSLVPDVGLINAVGHNSDGNLKYIARPYLGLNWHFSGINRSQYLRQIHNRKFRHRWSLALGITLGNIDTQDYEDLFNNISPTVGMNFRWTRQIRTGAGVLFVREKNQNPIVNDTKVALAPYISISFDLGLLSEASKLTKLIGF
ncbi:hypothetical protein ACFO3O_09195 [Dokdonia ponticola]|uniref:Uncharacterized protein n=1 Tax=Dokdonia ponticola TaxID=2041041 RepID=A0ABV9HXP4_9FLAO